jgi:hypothetical protein
MPFLYFSDVIVACFKVIYTKYNEKAAYSPLGTMKQCIVRLACGCRTPALGRSPLFPSQWLPVTSTPHQKQKA